MNGAGAGLLLGLLGGGVLWATLLWNSRLYLRGGAPLGAIGVQALRLGLLGALLAGLAREGAAPLLAGALGVLLARAVVLRRVRRRLS
ncbi:MAG: hypothetical protein KGI51_11005 [Rhodospirillales bacterium]|nr:hypothetical protein [Rhodospirillales bacterium]